MSIIDDAEHVTDFADLGIIAFTIIVRLVTFPLTLRQLHQTRAMQSIQPTE